MKGNEVRHHFLAEPDRIFLVELNHAQRANRYGVGARVQ